MRLDPRCAAGKREWQALRAGNGGGGGLNPDSFVLMRPRDAQDVLRGGLEAARCAALGAVLIEPVGMPKALI